MEPFHPLFLQQTIRVASPSLEATQHKRDDRGIAWKIAVMAASHCPYRPQQQRLLPSVIKDWLPEGQLAYFISDDVDSQNLSALYARDAKGGPRNRTYHPAITVKLLITWRVSVVWSSWALWQWTAPSSKPAVIRP